MIDSKHDSLRCAVAPLLVIVLATSSALAQDTLAKSHRRHVGTALCRNCHYRSPAAPQVNLAGNNQFDNWFERTEMYRWEQRDKHYQAYAVLHNRRSQAMGAALGIKEIHKEHSCLACHTSYSQSGLLDLEKHGTAQDHRELQLGVSCEGCHGPAGGNSATNLSGWRVRHFDEMHVSKAKDEPRWRFLSPEVKLSKYGYWDVRSPVSKARICASCHVGDKKAGRVLTHDMYAAGHPPLPGFEIETFIQQMPRHWTTIKEKKPVALREAFLEQTQDKLFAKNFYRPQDLHQTRSMLVGAVVSLAQSLELTAELCETPGTWPELAQFECYACHHDLRDPAWRQKRKPPGGLPGRPALREWTTVLAQVALGNEVQAKELKGNWSRIGKTLGEKPFGQKDTLQEQAASTASWLMVQARKLEGTRLDRAAGRQLLLKIARIGASQTLEFDSVRQLVWACQVIDDELGEQGLGSARKLLEQLGSTSIMTNLRKKTPDQVPDPLGKTARPGKTTIVEIDLSSLLPPIGQYRPEAVQKQFAAIVAALEK